MINKHLVIRVGPGLLGTSFSFMFLLVVHSYAHDEIPLSFKSSGVGTVNVIIKLLKINLKKKKKIHQNMRRLREGSRKAATVFSTSNLPENGF